MIYKLWTQENWLLKGGELFKRSKILNNFPLFGSLEVLIKSLENVSQQNNFKEQCSLHKLAYKEKEALICIFVGDV